MTDIDRQMYATVTFIVINIQTEMELLFIFIKMMMGDIEMSWEKD